MENSQEKSNESNYFLKDSDVHCQQGTSLMKDTLMENPSVNIADLPQVEALISVPKRKRKRARSSVPIIGDFNPDCLKGALASENITPENNSCVQYSGRDVHHDSPLGADTLLEEPSINVISDLVPAELPPHVDLSRRKRKKKKATIGAAPEPENSCLASCAGICAIPNSEKAKQHADLFSLQRKRKRNPNKWRKIDETDSNDRSCESPRTNEELSCSQGKVKNKPTKMSKAHENSYKSCDLSVGTSLVENIMPIVDPSLQAPVTESLEQDLEVAVAQSPMEGISTKTNSESSELIADLSCSRKKKKKNRKERCKTQGTNDESCGNDKICDLSVGTSLVENVMLGIDHSQHPPVTESLEQELEVAVAQSPVEGISTKTNSESSELIADLSCSIKKKKKERCKTQETNGESCGNDKICDLSVGTSLVDNIMPGIDHSQQPPVTESLEQELEVAVAHSPVEGISTKTNSKSSELIADLSCSRKKKKKHREERCKIQETNDESCGNDKICDLSVGTSLVENIMPGVDHSQQPPVTESLEQELEVAVAHSPVEGISTKTNSESSELIADLSCSRKKKKKHRKERCKTQETNDESCGNDKICDLSVGTSLVENIMPGIDHSQQPPVTESFEQELEVAVAHSPVEGISTKTNSESSELFADLSCSRKKKKKHRKERCKTQETNDESCGNDKICDLAVGTSLVEDIMPGIDHSQQPPVTESFEQELEVAVAHSPVEGISTKTNSESSQLIADLSCSRKKKKKHRKERCKTQETNDTSCGSDKICDLSVGTSLVENIISGIDHSQQPPVSEFSEQKLELPPPLMEGISTKTNSESSEPIADSSCSRKKKKRLKTHESNDRKCELSVGTLVENIMPGTDSSQKPPVLEFTDQKLELPQPLMERISTTANSEGPEPNADLSCSQEKKKKNRKRGHKTHESNDIRSDPYLGTSLEGNIIPGADLSVQPPVAIFSEQELEVEQPLVEGIGKRTNSESPNPIEDLSCSQKMKKKNGKKRCKIHVSNDESCDPSGDTSFVEKIIPGADPSLQPPLAILSEQELEAPQILLEESTFQEKNEEKEQNKRSNASRNNDTDHDIRAGVPCQVVIDVKGDENNNDNSLSEFSKLDPTNIQDITDIEQTETKTEVPSLPPLAVKVDVDVAVNVKEGNLSQISDHAAERSLVSCSKKKLLILDVNGLLADIVPQECYIPKQHKPDITISRKAVFKRPFCDEFLQFCFDRFNVGVWSSRTKKNVDMVMDFLLGDSRHKLLFCWNQSHCTTTRFNTIDNTDKPLVLKEVRKLWEKHDPNLPWVEGEYNESNTLLLDDSPYKALRNPANTAIFPYSYQFRDRRDTSLGPGGKIRSFLEGLAMADNVQKYVEQHPFGQRPITKSSLSWGFYRRVIEDGVQSPKD